MISGVTRSGLPHLPETFPSWVCGRNAKLLQGLGCTSHRREGLKRLRTTAGWRKQNKFNSQLWVLDFHFGLVLMGLWEKAQECFINSSCVFSGKIWWNCLLTMCLRSPSFENTRPGDVPGWKQIRIIFPQPVLSSLMMLNCGSNGFPDMIHLTE